ncbi:hypothetical protein [Effusibacillus lacus]|uniref:Uncharacterized protein n=2 Tax=Effusibacillus lacus TaxID=1348429 RepID=A0A292YKP7_9BACL|nr:hypothetical protein [Effusibacillus lacus]
MAILYGCRLIEAVNRLRREEKGAQAIEWVLLALVVIALMAGVSKYFQTESNTQGLAKALLTKLQNWVEGL